MRNIVLIALVLVSIYMDVVVAQNDVWIPCLDLEEKAEPLWLNTSSQRTNFRGHSMRVYATKPNNETYEDEWVELSMTDLNEYQAEDRLFSCSKSPDTPDDAGPLTPGTAVSLEDGMCHRTQGVRLLAPQVEEEYIAVNVTWPKYPSLNLILTLSLTNVTYKIDVPASDNTLNTPFTMEYNSSRPKFTVEMNNFPWDRYTPTRLTFFFQGRVSVIGPAHGRGYSDERKTYAILEAQSKRVNYKFEYLRAFQADGVHYVIGIDPANRNHSTFNTTLVSIPFSANMCTNKTIIRPNYNYDKLVYDPNVVALFTGDIDPSPSPSKRRLNPAAYAVPIAVVTALIVFIVLVVFVPAIGKRLVPALHHRPLNSSDTI